MTLEERSHGRSQVREGLYVYCIIGTGEARNFGPIGVGGRRDPVTTIAYRDLSAVVNTVPMDRYVVGRETLLCHERAIEKVMADHTVLPVRYYTVAPNAEEVRGLLRSRYAELKMLLRELDNKVELGLKVLWKDMGQVLQAGGADRPQDRPEAGTARTTTETSREARQALEGKRAEVSRRLLGPLRQLAMDLRLNRTYGDDMIMNAAFLVDRSREREFDARVERLAAQHADCMTFKYVGPAPPYSFVSIEIKDDEPPGPVPGREG